MDRRGFVAGALAAGALPSAVHAGHPRRIALISDLNGSYGSTGYGRPVHAAIARIVADRPDLVIVAGDMVAGQRAAPKLTGPELAAMWAGFDLAVAAPLRRAGIPMLAVAGNHDASAYPGFEAERRAFATAAASWQPGLPFVADRAWPFHFAARAGDVLVVGLDVTVPGLPAPPQMTWLRDLLAAGRGRNRAILVVGHLPLVPVAQGRERDIIGDAAFQRVLETGQAAAYLSGHHHAFAARRIGSVLHVAQGALGGGPRKRIGETARAPQSFTWLEISDSGGLTVREVLP
ncbi:metallophosphoesterase family protein [Rhodovulum euryhalinum]|uniref:3',5'-cyclic AMP phosphodiesterase CpdA n=1 Tax=Rhodovulum euryhalinum TaxID=35805 RepID=A0A4R2KDC1_9RHOB|nr:metallophosphoesterase [Rhodovulum euryhalinum]TCO71581.1 3',5'-cyclic AMP phosphodiesterase CpdA [Rhodovulum euryhalinum]